MRLHPSTTIPVGSSDVLTDTGNQSIDVPDGASGVIFLPITSGQTYTVSFTGAITDRATEGLALIQGELYLEGFLFWFDPVQVPTIYYNISGGSMRYQFVTTR